MVLKIENIYFAEQLLPRISTSQDKNLTTRTSPKMAIEIACGPYD